eukprot:221965-Chlamydomonas_euryale.AAC.4
MERLACAEACAGEGQLGQPTECMARCVLRRWIWRQWTSTSCTHTPKKIVVLGNHGIQRCANTSRSHHLQQPQAVMPLIRLVTRSTSPALSRRPINIPCIVSSPNQHPLHCLVAQSTSPALSRHPINIPLL